MRHTLAATLQKGDFPWQGPGKRPIITVTEVRISPDLRNATIYVMPLGGQHTKEVQEQLNAHAHFFKNELAHNMQLRFIPQLRFTTDSSFDYAEKIERILHDPAVAKDLKPENDEG